MPLSPYDDPFVAPLFVRGVKKRIKLLSTPGDLLFGTRRDRNTMKTQRALIPVYSATPFLHYLRGRVTGRKQ